MMKIIFMLFVFIYAGGFYHWVYGFQPWDIWNKIFHFDMNNLDQDNNSSTQPSNAQAIETLVDPDSIHISTQSDINKQARFDTQAFTARWALFFDGVDDLYTINDHYDITANNRYDEKSFAVIIETSDDISALQTIYEQWGKDKWYAIQIENSRLYVWVWNSIDWPEGQQFKIADLWTIATNQVYNIVVSHNGLTQNNFSVYLNSQLVKNIMSVASQTAHGSCVLSGSFDCYMFASGWSIGIWATKNDTLRLSNTTQEIVWEDHFYKWHIWELISWNSSLTPQQAQNLFWYFDTKWWILTPEISIISPAEVWSVNIWDSQFYIEYNDFQNGVAINTASDDLKLYKWENTSWWNNIANNHVNFFTKEISGFQALYDVTNLSQWKYKLEFSISKTNGKKTTFIREFFVWELLPWEISNPVFHYDAQDINADGNLGNNPAWGTWIQTLVDKFNGYNAVQNTASNRPTLLEDSINWYSAISFNGSNQFFNITNTSDINSRNNPPYTQKSFAAVFQTWDDINTFQTIYEQWWNARGYSFVIDQWSVYAWVWNTSEWDVWHQYKSVNLWVAQPNTTYFVMIVQDSSYSDDSLNTLKIYLNGNLSSLQDHTDPQIRHPWGISIGRVNGNTVSASTNTVVNNSGHYFQWALWELISWNYALDQADVNGIQQYFSNKWWIVLFSEKFPIPTPTSDQTPSYTFTTNKAGSLEFIWSCRSSSTQAIIWENVVVLSADTLWNNLPVGIYDDCSIILTDDNGFPHVLNITAFEVIATSYALSEMQAIASPSDNHFPQYSFSSPIEGQIQYFWSCSSNTQYASIGTNIITLNYLADGVYDNCYLRVINANQQSEYLLISSFEIISQAPVIQNTNIETWKLLASWNTVLNIGYSDTSQINLSSAEIILEKYNLTTQSWWDNQASDLTNQINISQTQVNYQFNINDFGKYRYNFSIKNIHWAELAFTNIFYVDDVNLRVNTASIDMWILDNQNINYSQPIEIQVETLWAGFDLKIQKEQNLSSHNNSINDFDTNYWYWYDATPLWDWLASITSIETFITQWENINQNWEKNTYIYYLRLWAIIDELQSAGNYDGKIKFWIQLQYD